MAHATAESFAFPSQSAAAIDDPLTELLRHGARQLLSQAVEAEVQRWIADHAHLTDEQGHRQVVRNGHASPRTVVTGVGPVEVAMPRVHDRRPEGERQRFTSSILPPYLRKAKSIDALIPWLYLKGVSTGDFTEALQALLGPACPGLSASTVTRLKQVWEDDFRGWSQRDLSGKRYVYLWADGIHFNVRLEEDRTCILVLMGATADGHKELIAVQDGYRESEQSWKGLLLDVKRRGLTVDPSLATGDGALGFWKALPQVFATTRTQRCWVHKTCNVLDKLPKGEQPAAKAMLHEIWMAATRNDAIQAFGRFIEVYGAKWPRAAACLEKDRIELLAFYDFPAEHWGHLRTSNPIESTFSTVRLRTYRTKGPGSREAGVAMAFKLARKAESRWRKLNGSERLQDLIDDVVFVDGERVAA